MAWFSNSDKRKPRAKVDLWVKCESCKAHVYKEEWAGNLNVCPKCNYHGAITSQKRIDQIIDAGTFTETGVTITPNDPLQFVDGKGSYAAKIVESREKIKINESVITGTGKIHGAMVSLAVMDFRFLGGSLGCATGEKILQAANLAYEQRLPFIIFSASGGARMQEGTLSLMQMAKTCAGIARLAERKLAYISVLTNPTTGGVSASYAMVGDINIAEPGALIGFAGRRVIEQTIKQKLPDNFQKAEFLLEHGFIDTIVNRRDMKNHLKTIITYYNNQR